MSGICDTCQRNRDCRKPIGGMDSCRLYLRAKESNYTRLFGTPERAARTLHELCGGCCGLPERVRGDYDALLEWLRGDA